LVIYKVYLCLCFDVSLTVHLSITLANDQLDPQIFNTFITILYMYMFRAISCSSSGGQSVLIQHCNAAIYIIVILDNSLVFRVTTQDAVLIHLDLLRMSKILLETRTCRGL